MINQPDALRLQFDWILARIEAGDANRGIAHLAGMLDAVLLDCGSPEQVRQSLLAHPLGDALRHPALAAPTRWLGIDAALRAREELTRSTVEQARRRGERIITFQDECIPSTERRKCARAGGYDLILAAQLPDRLTPDRLSREIESGVKRLAAGGRLVMSAFVLGHLACGWHTIWLGREVHRHDPEGIAEMARAAGLEPRLFHDASNCLVWAELRLGTQCRNLGDR